MSLQYSSDSVKEASVTIGWVNYGFWFGFMAYQPLLII